MALEAYRGKRNFGQTPEPKGKRGSRGGGQRRFVVQKHHARALHYDLRLELGGVLVSWAVPRGIPLKAGEKRLAVKVEDHPLSYREFEGNIPAGEYGGGTVQVWDRGTFLPTTRSPLKDLEGGKLHFTLEGQKLGGEWFLVRMRQGNEWLLIRGSEEHRKLTREERDTSALSGKTVGEIRRGKPDTPNILSSNEAPFIEPMKALLVDSPGAGRWRYELKFDGYRALACKEGKAVALLSRTRQELTQRFPEVAEAVAALMPKRCVLDGEVVALDPEGRPSFQLLQRDASEEERPPIRYYAFDLLALEGKSLVALPLEKRRSKLERLLSKRNDGLLRYSTSFESDVETLLERAASLKIEGLIGKRSGSLYEPGRRSGAWIKLKLIREQEFVIGGYTPPKGGRSGFGAILVGTYQGARLLYAGKVGSGFSNVDLQSLSEQFHRFASAQCPFADLPEARASRYGQTITAAAMKQVQWIKPRLVAQVRFSEWTKEGRLRHPVFVALRTDKPVKEVVRERVN